MKTADCECTFIFAQCGSGINYLNMNWAIKVHSGVSAKSHIMPTTQLKPKRKL